MDTQEPPREGPPCFRCEGVTEFHSRIVDQNRHSVFWLYRCPTCQNQQWTPVIKSRDLDDRPPAPL